MIYEISLNYISWYWTDLMEMDKSGTII